MPKNVIMPALGVAQETGRVLQWLKAEGELIRQGEMLLEIETDKATIELEAAASGILRNITANAGDEVPVGTVIAKIWGEAEADADSDAPPTSGPLGATAPPAPAALRAGGDGADHRGNAAPSAPSPLHCTETAPRRHAVPASPKARRLAAERGIDLSRASGTGPAGAVIAANLARQSSDRKAVPSIWRVMAERTAEAWRTVPHFYLAREIDATRLVSWRESLRGRSATPITFTDLLVAKVASGLRGHLQLNSEWREGTVQLHAQINIGLAVAVDDGLVVPVIRHADQLTVEQIAATRAHLVETAQAGKLSPDDISSGTFTISNLGMYGVDYFQAIVNPPQAAILAVGRIAPRLAVVDGKPAVTPMMTLTLSCDHRAVDGARAARFLGELAASLEQIAPSHPESLTESHR